jgi:DNA-binding NtrC family response regulator
MTARVLVVDDVEANVKLLEARLTAEYFEVRTARTVRKHCMSARGSGPTWCCSM